MNDVLCKEYVDSRNDNYDLQSGAKIEYRQVHSLS
jgi:hypothetical protein